MYRQNLRRAFPTIPGLLGIAGLLIALAGVTALAAAGSTRQDADVLKQKVSAIIEIGAVSSSSPRQPRRTMLTENELNAYLSLDAAKDLPIGIVEPSVSILGPGRLAGRAVVDLDAVKREQPSRGLLDPRRLLVGRLPVTATGALQTGKGLAWFSLESATVGGIPMPKAVLQEILSYYSRSPERPEGLSLDDPIILPSNIREIQVDRGQAIVIQ